MVAFMGSAQVNPLFTSSNLPVDLCQKFPQVCFHLNYIIENNISALFFTSTELIMMKLRIRPKKMVPSKGKHFMDIYTRTH